MAKRVLVFAEYGVRNGAENSWLSLARVLKTSDWEFIVATPDGTEFATAVSKDFQLAPLRFHDSDDQRKNQEDIRLEMAQLIASVEPDIVHCNSLSTSRLCGPVTNELSVPAVGHLRDILKLSKKAVADINCLDQIITVSNATRDFHIDQGMNAEKAKTIYNGVDLNTFHPNPRSASLKVDLGLPDEARLISCIGQIGMRKGTDISIRCFHILQQKTGEANLFLAIVGQRNSKKQEAIEYEQQCHELVQKLGLSKHVLFLGRRNDVASLLNESILVLHSARQEPLGRVLLEASASGCPIVATDVGGTREILSGLDAMDDLICPMDDPESMAMRAIRLLNDNDFYGQVGKSLRDQAVNKFDIVNSAAVTEQLYEELIG